MTLYQRRKLAWLERCGLQDHEEWPLFGVKKHITQSGQVWVMLTGLPPFSGRQDVLRTLLQEMRRLEHALEAQGIMGWIQAIRKGNDRMRRWTEMIGATLYADTADHWFFQKEANRSALPRSLKELVHRYGGAHHGAA